MSEERFWHSSYKTIRVYEEAYKRKTIEIDRMSYHMGIYVFEAVSIALNNGFGKKSQKKNYRKKPLLADVEEEWNNERMSEEERMDKVEKVFQMLASPESKQKVVNHGGQHH